MNCLTPTSLSDYLSARVHLPRHTALPINLSRMALLRQPLEPNKVIGEVCILDCDVDPSQWPHSGGSTPQRRLLAEGCLMTNGPRPSLHDPKASDGVRKSGPSTLNERDRRSASGADGTSKRSGSAGPLSGVVRRYFLSPPSAFLFLASIAWRLLSGS